MSYPPRAVFRTLAAAGLGLMTISSLAEELGWFISSPQMRDIFDWNYYGSAISIGALTILWWALLGTWLISGIAFLLFLSWARWVLVALFGIQLGLAPFRGVSVSAGVYDAVALAGYWCFVVPFVLSFFSPCDRYFHRSQSQRG